MRQVKQYSCSQFMSTAKIWGMCFSPDEERILFTSDASGISNAYEVVLRDQTQRQLTFSVTENIQALSYFPNDARILVIKDPGNLENSALCVMEPDGSDMVLTPGKEVQTFFHHWSSDQRSFYVSTNERDQHVFDLYKIDAYTFARKVIYRAAEKFYFAGMSEDENYVVFLKSSARKTDSDIFLYDVSKAEMKCLTSHEGEVVNCAPVFNQQADAIYYITDKDSDFRYVQRLNLASGETHCVEGADSDVAWTFFSPDYRRRITFWNDASTLRRMKIQDEETGDVFTLPGFSQRSITSALFSKSGRRLAFYVDGDRSPSNLYVYDFETKSITQLTEGLNPDIDPEDLVESETVSFNSFDGLEIPCLLWRPHGTSQVNPAPALLWVHGGPGGRMAKGYRGRIQYLVNHGYVVLGLNYRGSSGFGKKFFKADHRKHGREPLWDCIAARKYLASLSYVDPASIGIGGASFGGYMALAALTFHPKEFAAGVNICGLSNLISFAKTLPKYWNTKRFYDKLGDPEKDEELLRAISPFFHSERIKKPVMILQGANDPRCPREQSDQMVEALRSNGGRVEYLVYDDEAHGFRKRKNAIHAYEAILNFLDSTLKQKLRAQTEPTRARVAG